MRQFDGMKIPILLCVAALTSCGDAKVIAKVPPKGLTVDEHSGQQFRKKVIAQWDMRPSEFYLEMDELCRATFSGKSLQEANAIMRGAGQSFDLSKTDQVEALTPPGTTPYAGGFGLHSSLISSASFNVMFYAATVGPPDRLVVKEVGCGVRQTSL